MADHIFKKILKPSPRGRLWQIFVLIVILATFCTVVDIDNKVYTKSVNWVAKVTNNKVQIPNNFKLGLDLQGGMYLVMEVNTAKLLENLATDPDQQFNDILSETIEDAKTSDEDIVSILTSKLAENNIRLSRYFGSIRQEDPHDDRRGPGLGERRGLERWRDRAPGGGDVLLRCNSGRDPEKCRPRAAMGPDF